MQIKIRGSQYGEWGIQKYGREKCKVDALEFYRERIQALADAIKRGSEHLLRDPDATLPAAFITFKTRTAQVRDWGRHMHVGNIQVFKKSSAQPLCHSWVLMGMCSLATSAMLAYHIACSGAGLRLLPQLSCAPHGNPAGMRGLKLLPGRKLATAFGRLKCVETGECTQAVASTAMLHHDRTAWLADAAPEPRDVIWSNLG